MLVKQYKYYVENVNKLKAKKRLKIQDVQLSGGTPFIFISLLQTKGLTYSEFAETSLTKNKYISSSFYVVYLSRLMFKYILSIHYVVSILMSLCTSSKIVSVLF